MSAPKTAVQSAKVRTWKPMAIGTALLLLAPVLLWPFCLLLRSYLHTKSVVDSCCGGFSETNARGAIASLGGEKNAARELAFYLRFPRIVAENRSVAVYLLGYCGKEGVPALCRSLDDKEPWVCALAIRSLGAIGPPSYPAAEKLVALLHNEIPVTANSHISQLAEDALAEIGPMAVAPLLRDLRSVNPPKLRVLGIMGDHQRIASASGISPQSRLQEAERIALVHAYGYVPAVSSVEAFVGPKQLLLYVCLPADLAPHKYEAAWALGRACKFGLPQDKQLAIILKEALAANDPDVRQYTALAVGLAGIADDSQRLSELLLSAKEPDTVRQEAAKALGTIGAGANQFAGSLVKATDDKDLLVRLAAAAALRYVDPGSAESKAALAKARGEVEKVGIPKVIRAAYERSGKSDPNAGAWLVKAICEPREVLYIQGAFVDDHYEVDTNEDFNSLRGGRKNCITKEGAKLLNTQGYVDLKPFILVALPGSPEGAFIYIWGSDKGESVQGN